MLQLLHLGIQLLGAVDLDARAILHRQHLAGGVLPINLWHLDPLLVGKILPDHVQRATNQAGAGQSQGCPEALSHIAVGCSFTVGSVYCRRTARELSAPEAVGVLAFQAVVDLLVQDAGALVVDGHPVARCAIRLRVQALQPLRQHPDVLEVNVEQRLEPRPLHLHHHSLPPQLGQVHLQCMDADG
jgi:hypothetical protein